MTTLILLVIGWFLFKWVPESTWTDVYGLTDEEVAIYKAYEERTRCQ